MPQEGIHELSNQFECLNVSKPPVFSPHQAFEKLGKAFEIYSKADNGSRYSVLKEIEERKDINIEVLPENYQNLQGFTDAYVGRRSFFTNSPEGRVELASKISKGDELKITVGAKIEYETEISTIAHTLNHEISGHVNQLIKAYDKLKDLEGSFTAREISNKVSALQREVNTGVHESIAKLNERVDGKSHLIDEVNHRMQKQVGRDSMMARQLAREYDEDIDLQISETGRVSGA